MEVRNVEKSSKKHRENHDFVKFSKIGSEKLSEGSGSGLDVLLELSGAVQERPRAA